MESPKILRIKATLIDQVSRNEDSLAKTIKSIGSAKTGMSFRRPQKASHQRNANHAQYSQDGRFKVPAANYSFQRKDNNWEVGGGRINSYYEMSGGASVNDLNSIIYTDDPRKSLKNESIQNMQLQQPLNEKNRISHWDPYELAAKIKD